MSGFTFGLTSQVFEIGLKLKVTHVHTQTAKNESNLSHLRENNNKFTVN